MSMDLVKRCPSRWGRDGDVREFEASSATVEPAAAARNAGPERIAKTLPFAKESGCLLIAAAGNARGDSAKCKRAFGFKGGMPPPDPAAEERTEYSGGKGRADVCKRKE